MRRSVISTTAGTVASLRSGPVAPGPAPGRWDGVDQGDAGLEIARPVAHVTDELAGRDRLEHHPDHDQQQDDLQNGPQDPQRTVVRGHVVPGRAHLKMPSSSLSASGRAIASTQKPASWNAQSRTLNGCSASSWSRWV